MPASDSGFRGILQGVRIPGHTRYSNLFDPRALTATLYREGDFSEARIIDLRDALSAGGRYRLEEYFLATAGGRGE